MMTAFNYSAVPVIKLAILVLGVLLINVILAIKHLNLEILFQIHAFANNNILMFIALPAARYVSLVIIAALIVLAQVLRNVQIVKTVKFIIEAFLFC